MKPLLPTLGDTQRIVEWEELPDSVRAIPEGFNPLAAGVYMQHQTEWTRMIHAYDLAVAEKCRRSGITLATALDDTVTAASSKAAGGMNVFYIGDTREKGLEFIGYCAKFARTIVESMGGSAVSQIEQFLFEDQDTKGGDSKHINAFRIRFASGFRIVALSSRPENLRGLQGIVNIDEAAFHKNVGAVIESAAALLIWGGKIRVISTHNGGKNPFYQLVMDVKNGQYGASAGLFKITFDECVANGLYERVCFMQGKPATEDGKKDWYLRIRKAYGPRKAAMREELDTIPREGDGSALPGLWIERAMKAERPVLRLAYDDNFKFWPPDARARDMDAWLQKHLKPCLDALDKQQRWWFGMDFARKGHLSVITPITKKINLCRFVPFVIELHNCPIAQQKQALWTFIAALPNFSGGAMDATGPGQSLAEETWEKWNNVQEVTFTQNWYRDNMGALVDAFESDLMDIPRDREHDSDLRDLERVNGIIKPPDTAAETEGGVARHADYAISLALADFAARNASHFATDGYIAIPRHARGGADKRRDDDINPYASRRM